MKNNLNPSRGNAMRSRTAIRPSRSTVRPVAWLLGFASLLALLASPVVAQAGAAGDPPTVDAQPRLLAAEAAADYLEKARYPEHSKALPAGAMDPLREERRVQPITVRARDKSGASLSVWSTELSYLSGQAPVLRAVAAGFQPTGLTGEIADASGRVYGRLVFHDDGVSPDRVAGDGVYSARHVPDKALRIDLARAFRVTVDAGRVDAEPLSATTGFVISNPWAELTGAYRHAVRDGNLVIEAEVDVRREGRFHLSGVLHTVAGEPVGTAQTARRLERGSHWLPLEFFGLIFHDRQVRGPVKLGSVALSTTGGMPNALNPLVEDAYMVLLDKSVQFRAEPFGNAADLDAARRLEESARKSLAARGLDR